MGAAITDSETEIRYDIIKKPAISNLLSIYHLYSGKTIPALEKQYAGKGYSKFKIDLAVVINSCLFPIKARFHEFEKNPKTTLAILKKGAENARKVAEKTLHDVKEKIGFLQ